MRKGAATLILSGFAVAALTAQAPAVPAQTPPAPPDGSTVTVTGCLRAGEQPDTYVLERIIWNESASGTARDPAAHHDTTPQRDRPTTPATAATGQRDTPAAGETLRLAGAAARVKIGDHVNHTVTVTGMLAPGDPVVRPGVMLPETPPKGDTTSRNPEAGQQESKQRVLNVRSLTHVAAQCK